MGKNILIIGAGFGQIPAIQTAKEMSLEVIAVDKNPDAVGMSLADFSYAVDIVDFQGVLEIARKHNISGVMTMQSDLPIPTVGFINDALALPGISFEVAKACSNKNETRLKLKEKKAAQPRFEIADSLLNAKEAAYRIGFPCVVKASDSSGSRGISKVNKPKEVETAFYEALKYSRQQAVIVEEFINGIEFGAQTFSENGKCKVVLLHNDTMSPPPYMIPIGHSFPFIQLSRKETTIAIEDVKNAIEAVGITDGPANVDLILDTETKRVKIIEIGARIGATCLPELVYYHTGIDWVKQTILSAIGDDVDLHARFKKPVAALIIEALKDGIYKGYRIRDEEAKKELLELEVTVKNGEEVNILRKGTDRVGKILAYGNTVKEAEDTLVNIRKQISIIVES